LISEERKERDSYMASRQDTSTLWASVIYFLRLYYNFLEQFQVYSKIEWQLRTEISPCASRAHHPHPHSMVHCWQPTGPHGPILVTQSQGRTSGLTRDVDKRLTRARHRALSPPPKPPAHPWLIFTVSRPVPSPEGRRLGILQVRPSQTGGGHGELGIRGLHVFPWRGRSFRFPAARIPLSGRHRVLAVQPLEDVTHVRVWAIIKLPSTPRCGFSCGHEFSAPLGKYQGARLPARTVRGCCFVRNSLRACKAAAPFGIPANGQSSWCLWGFIFIFLITIWDMIHNFNAKVHW